MKKLTITTIAISMLLIASGCSTNNQTAQQKEACTADDPHPWCMQLAQTKQLGSWDSNGPTNPEMRDPYDNVPYPTNPALQLISPGHGPLMIGGLR
jgi:hypothetical protein